MGYEVEIKFRAPDPQALLARLIALGASGGALSEHADHYLAHPSRDFARTDEALRLRRVGDENCVTYKGPKQPGPTKTREELEIPFAAGAMPFELLSKLFERLGFRPVEVVTKTRRSFALERVGRTLAVTIDDAGDLGTFAEVETLASGDADLPAAQAAVIALAGELGLSEVEPRSYLRMKLERAGRA